MALQTNGLDIQLPSNKHKSTAWDWVKGALFAGGGAVAGAGYTALRSGGFHALRFDELSAAFVGGVLTFVTYKFTRDDNKKAVQRLDKLGYDVVPKKEEETNNFH